MQVMKRSIRQSFALEGRRGNGSDRDGCKFSGPMELNVPVTDATREHRREQQQRPQAAASNHFHHRQILGIGGRGMNRAKGQKIATNWPTRLVGETSSLTTLLERLARRRSRSALRSEEFHPM
jgi:hypothetical protein